MKYKNIYDTIIRLIKEFWIPLILSIIWTMHQIKLFNNIDFSSYNLFIDSFKKIKIIDFSSILEIFGPSFFLFSWITGQFVRIKKQVRVDHGLTEIEERLKQLAQEQQERIENVICNITGGDSFPWFQILLNNRNPFGNIVCHHSGKFPLYDVTARICNLQNLTVDPPTAILSDPVITIAHMISGHCTFRNIPMPISGVQQDYNIFTTARNGSFTQSIRMRLVNGAWVVATKVERNNFPEKSTNLYQNIDPSFPKNPDGSINW